MELNDLIPLCSQDKLELFAEYAKQLQAWNEKINLTAITQMDEIVEKHFYDCLLPLQKIPQNSHVCDVGSGAGFPGLVFAIARDDLKLTLVEPTQKRCVFLQEMIKVLNLKNVVVKNQRAEDLKEEKESFDVVTARAVANLTILSELCIPLLKQGGYFLAMKGANGLEEVEQAQFAIQTLGCRLETDDAITLQNGDGRHNLWIKKVKPTPPQYPRNYAQMKKKPLERKEHKK